MTTKRGPKVVVQCSSFDHPRDRLTDFTKSHSFIHSLGVLLPRETSHIPAQLAAGQQFNSVLHSLEKGSFHTIRANLCAFLEPSFLDAVVENPEVEFRALSVNTPLDRTDAAAVTADGHLHLRLTKAAYNTVGLVGSCSAYDPDVYCIQIKLTSPNFRSRARYYQRVYDCLQSRTSPLDFICSTSKGGPSVLEFAKPEHVSCSRLLSNDHFSGIIEGPIPQLQQISRPVRGRAQGSAESLKPAELERTLEWLGGLSSGVHIPGAAEEDDCIAGQIESHRWTGLILPDQVKACISEARNCVDSGQYPWAAVSVWGFADSPVSWAGAEHSRDHVMGGENDYVILLLPEQQYVLFVLSGACDGFRKV